MPFAVFCGGSGVSDGGSHARPKSPGRNITNSKDRSPKSETIAYFEILPLWSDLFWSFRGAEARRFLSNSPVFWLGSSVSGGHCDPSRLSPFSLDSSNLRALMQTAHQQGTVALGSSVGYLHCHTILHTSSREWTKIDEDMEPKIHCRYSTT